MNIDEQGEVEMEECLISLGSRLPNMAHSAWHLTQCLTYVPLGNNNLDQIRLCHVSPLIDQKGSLIRKPRFRKGAKSMYKKYQEIVVCECVSLCV